MEKCKEERNVSFQLNNTETIDIAVGDDIDLLYSLTTDNDFSVHYIEELISNNFLEIEGPLYSIHRVTGNSLSQIFQTQEESTLGSKFNDLAKPEQDLVWNDEATNLLLERYEVYLPLVGPMKKFKTKKKLWEQICTDLNEILGIVKTPIQIENRYKTLLKRKKRAVENNSQTGTSRIAIPFEEPLQKIAALDDSIEPEVLRSAKSVRILKEKTNTIQQSTPGPSTSKIQPSSSRQVVPPVKQIRTMQKTLLAIHENKAERKEKRHQEKMTLFREYLQLKKDRLNKNKE